MSDYTGREMYRLTNTAAVDKWNIPTANLEAGIYFISLQSGKVQWQGKLVVQR
jgi:hypothetical protein